MTCADCGGYANATVMVVERGVYATYYRGERPVCDECVGALRLERDERGNG